MKILIDECMPWKIGRHLPGHSCEGVSKAGFAGQKNGALLSLAEKSGYDVLLTIDQGIPFEQQLEGRHISLIVIRAPSNKMNVLAESAQGISPRAAHRTGLEPLDSSGSCHPLKAAAFHQDQRVPPVVR